MAYLYLAKQIGIVGAFALWAYVVARGLFARSSLRLSLVEEVALLVPAGLALGILLLLGLGLAGALTGPGILSGAGLALALACWRLRAPIASGLSRTLQAAAGLSGIGVTVEPARSASVSREALVRFAMIAIVGTVLVPVALDCLTPPLRSDEVRYHLPYALHFVEQGRIVPDLNLRFPFFTLNVNLLYAAGLVFGDDVTPHFVHLLLGALAGLALYVLAAPVCGRVTALCAVMLFFVTPNFSVFAATAYIDLGLAAFITATIACLDRARDRPALVACAGLAFGAALGTKYLALVLVPLLVAWAAYRTRAGAQMARFTAIAVLTGAPWYVYNVIWTGNPVSPFAGEWFGSWPWTAEDLASQTQQLTQERYERSLTGLLFFPYYLVTDSWRFSIPSVPVLLVPGLAALVLLPFWNRDMRPYGVIALVTIVAWIFSTPFFRYLTAILPVLCLISVWSVERALWLLATLAAQRRPIPEAVRTRLSYAAAAIVIILAEYHFWNHNRWLDRDAVTERVVHRDRFLRDRLPVYGVVEHLRRSGVRDETIFAFPSSALLSYVRTNRIVGDWFGPMGRRQFRIHTPCPERFLEQLRRDGFSLLVLSHHKHAWLSAWNDYFSSLLVSEYTDRFSTVYRIGSGAPPASSLPRFTIGRNDPHVVPWFPFASDASRQGAARIVNRSDKVGTVVIHGISDTGTRNVSTFFVLGAGKTRHLRPADFMKCAVAKGDAESSSDGETGSWWLSLVTELDIEVSSYVDTGNGFTTSMHDVASTTRGPDGQTMHHVPFFNPGNERSRESRLRLVNPGNGNVDVRISARDDAGEAASDEVRLSLPGGTACWLAARVLESGTPDGDGFGCDIISGRLGSGKGRWRLSVSAAGGDIRVMSLLFHPGGPVSNLSASGGVGSGVHTLPLVLPVPHSKEEPDGFARIVNHTDNTGTVEIHGIDDTGTSYGPITLTLEGQEAVHLDSGDLVAGNASKGLPEGFGDDDGYWRLRLVTELDLEALAYARTDDGLVTSMHEVARTTQNREGETVHHVPYFNSAGSTKQASWLRLSNSGRRDVEVTIEGRDSAGRTAPDGPVGLVLPAGQACMLSARTLESGKPDSGFGTCAGAYDGRLGEGTGKWSLSVIAEGDDLQVMSLLKSSAGYLANLSTSRWAPRERRR